MVNQREKCIPEHCCQCWVSVAGFCRTLMKFHHFPRAMSILSRLSLGLHSYNGALCHNAQRMGIFSRRSSIYFTGHLQETFERNLYVLGCISLIIWISMYAHTCLCVWIHVCISLNSCKIHLGSGKMYAISHTLLVEN